MSLGNYLFDARKNKEPSTENFLAENAAGLDRNGDPSFPFQRERQNKSGQIDSCNMHTGFRRKYASISSPVPHPKSRIWFPFSVGSHEAV